MRPWASLVGWLGAVALGFAAISFLIQLASGNTSYEVIFTLGNFAVGLILVAIAGITNLRALRERARSGEARRVGKYGTSALLGTLLQLALLGIAAALFSVPQTTSPARQHRWDWTEAKSHSLSPQSKEVLLGLKDTLHVTGLYAQSAAAPAKDLVERYRLEAPDKLAVEFIDPQAQPGRLRGLNVQSERLAGGLLHLKLGQESTEVSDLSEEAFTNAIVKLTRREKKKVYLLLGHNERPIEGEGAKDVGGFQFALDALKNESYETSGLLLAANADVPADAQAVILAGPTRPYHEAEHAALGRYLARGGSLLVLLDPRAKTDLYDDLAKWGVELGDDVIVDQLQGLAGRPTTPFVSDFADHPISKALRGEAVLLHTARSVKPVAGGPGSFTELAHTGPASWGETDFARLESTGEVEPDGADPRGPVSVAVAGEVKLGEGKTAKPGRLVVIGDSDFATNQLINEFSNRDLLLNSVNWLMGDVDAITIRPGQPRASRLQLTAEQFVRLRFLSLFVLPEAIAALGVVAWWRRRRAPGR